VSRCLVDISTQNKKALSISGKGPLKVYTDTITIYRVSIPFPAPLDAMTGIEAF